MNPPSEEMDTAMYKNRLLARFGISFPPVSGIISA